MYLWNRRIARQFLVLVLSVNLSATTLSAETGARASRAKGCLYAIVLLATGATAGSVVTMIEPTANAIRRGFVDLKTQSIIDETERTTMELASVSQNTLRWQLNLTRSSFPRATLRVDSGVNYLLDLAPEHVSPDEITMMARLGEELLKAYPALREKESLILELTCDGISFLDR